MSYVTTRVIDTAKRSQQYYDDLAKVWNKGVAYFNPRTGNTLCTKNGITSIVTGRAGTNLETGTFVLGQGAREQMRIFHRFPSETTITRRKPNNYGIWDTLTKANSTSQTIRHRAWI